MSTGDSRTMVQAAEEESSGSSDDDSQSTQEILRTPSQIEAANKAKGSFKRPETWMIAFGALLAVCAGMVNVVCILHLGTVVSHMTGMATKIGLHLQGVRIKNETEVQMKIWDWNSTLTELNTHQHFAHFQDQVQLVLSFTFGAFLTGLVVPKNALHFGGDSFYGTALVGNSLLLFAAWWICRGVLPHHEDSEQWYGYAACLAAMASGLQNAMCSMHLGAVVRTTHVTGTVTDIGSTSGRACAILLRRVFTNRPLTYVQRVEMGVDCSKLMVLNTMFFAFLFGCFLGAALYAHFVLNTFLIPATITMVCGILYTCFSGVLRKQISKMQREKIEEDVHDIDITLERVRSFMKGKESSDPDRTGSLGGISDQVAHAVEIAHQLEVEVHEMYDHDSGEESRSSPRSRKSKHDQRNRAAME